MATALRKPRDVREGQSYRADYRVEVSRDRRSPRQLHGGETHLQRLERLRHAAEGLRQTMVKLGDTILARVPNEGLSDAQLTDLDARLCGATLQLRVLEHVLSTIDTINEGRGRSF